MQDEPGFRMEILFLDDHLAAIGKPSGLLVHRTTLAPDRDTCMRRLRDHLGRHVYPVHRLDRATSGVLLFALDPTTAAAASGLFASREVTKRYLAVARGFAPQEAEVDYPLADERGGEPAEAFTSFTRRGTVELPIAVGRYPSARYSLVEARPRTGRIHQIRRHLAHLRHPIVGDTVHGEGRHNRLFREEFGIHRLLLHAASLRLTHPVTGAEITIVAPLPTELAALFERLGWPTEVKNILGEG